MSDEIKIFLGAEDDQVDFSGLRPLAKRSKREGFVMALHTVSLEEKQIDFVGRRVVIRGAYTGACISTTVEQLLDGEVEEVTVDLPNCRCSERDRGANRDSLEIRRNDVLRGISKELRGDKRLRFNFKRRLTV